MSILGWVAGYRWASGGQLRLAPHMHWVMHVWAWSCLSLPVQLPAHFCGAIIETLGFRSHSP